MKTQSFIKKVILNLMLVSAIAFAITCNKSHQPEDSKEMAEEQNDAKFDDNSKENDAQFLVNAAEINLLEIQLSELALERAAMQDVKNLAKEMADVHNKSLKDLNDMASKKMISVPTALTKEGQDTHQKLMDKGANDFDKEYCDMMVSGHKDAIDKFEKASKECADPEIQQWAMNTLPVLREHLSHAESCQEKCKQVKM